MPSIFEILNEINADNGSNYKMDVLRRHADNELLQRVLKMAYDRVAFTYGITMATQGRGIILSAGHDPLTLSEALDILEYEFATRNLTGHAAISKLEEIRKRLSNDDRDVVEKIINRDLRINMGRSNINKVFKGLIVKPVYMRCGLFNEKTKKKINPNGAYIQLKADGTYREFTVENGVVTCNSRSGESYEYPALDRTLINYPDGHYIGELTVEINGKVQDRATGNGLINSDNPPHDNIMLDLWDYVTLEEYTGASQKIQGVTPYHRRFARLQEIVDANQPSNIRVIETKIVSGFSEALQKCSEWMTAGFEGAILKDADAIFRDGTSPQQLKLKLEIDADVRIIGYKPGTIGTKREGKIGSIQFATDDSKVKGYASGFSDAQLDDFTARWDEINNMIMTVTFNDLTKGRVHEHYALSHPRFVELRYDKTETDTLERILESVKSSKHL